MNITDEYGLPPGILGLHPDEFYSSIGRVVCVCAVLEDKVTTLRHTLEGVPQGQHTQQPIGRQIEAARSLSRLRLGDQSAATVDAFLSDVEVAFRHRNDLVHSSFPAQADGRLWGHRPTRDKGVTDGTADTVETSIDELRMFIVDLSNLVQRFNDVHAIAGTWHTPS